MRLQLHWIIRALHEKRTCTLYKQIFNPVIRVNAGFSNLRDSPLMFLSIVASNSLCALLLVVVELTLHIFSCQ